MDVASNKSKDDTKTAVKQDRDSALVYVVTENKQMGIRNSKRKLLRLAGK